MKINITTRYPIFAVEVSQEEFNLNEEETKKYLEFKDKLDETCDDEEELNKELYDFLITNFKYETTDIKIDCDTVEKDVSGDIEIVNFEEN